jgi:hypothetical protein
MTTTLTRNLKLRVDSNLTANAKYNLSRLDLLGATFQLDNTNNAILRSMQNIELRPNDASIGGSGLGGDVTIGSAGQPVDSFRVVADAVSLSAPLGFDDQASGGTKQLLLEYDSTLSGSVDTAADRTLRLDLNGANRNLILGGNYSQTGGSLSFTLAGDVAWELPAADSAGFLANDGAGVLTWETAGTGTVTSVAVSASAPLSSSGGPITGAGTIALGFQNQSANYVLAGPTSGGAAAPSFRALAAADFQDIPGYRAMSATWTSGTTKTITHGWNTRKVLVEVLDGDNGYREVIVDDESRPSDNTVVLESNEAPTNWLVLLKEVP